MLQKKFWKGKKVVVTGADGFIGSHLVEELINSGAKVRALVLYNSFGNWGLLEQIPDIRKKCEIIMGDINDPHFCLKLLENQEVVFHLAALINIPYSYIAPRSFFETNVLGTVNLLEAAKRHQLGRFIHTSTSETYGTAQYSPMDERHPLGAQSPYAASKVGADKAVLSYFLTFNLPVTVVRPFNNFGPRQSARGVIPTIITQLLAPNIKEVKLGNLSPVRDYLYVKDTARAYLMAAESKKTVGETVNLGTGKGYSIGDIFKLLSKITKVNKPVVTDTVRVRSKSGEVWKLVCDNRKFRKLTHWSPKMSFKEGLVETVEYIKNNMDKYKPDIYNV